MWRMSTRISASLLLIALAGCKPAAREPQFPAADRPVAPISASRWSTEEARDRVNESGTVMDRAGIKPGMTVADIGAGEGYYTIRLAQRVGEKGRVLAEDIVPQVRDALAARVTRERLDNVSVRLGEPADPSCRSTASTGSSWSICITRSRSPTNSCGGCAPRSVLEAASSWVDAERPTPNHGTPIALLRCEFAAVGYKMVENTPLPAVDGYIAQFEAVGERPQPDTIRPCKD
jgi:hypothetical protein